MFLYSSTYSLLTKAVFMELRTTQHTFLTNLRDLPRSLSVPGIIAALLVVITGYTGPILIVVRAAEAGGFTPEQTASTIWAIAVTNGIMTMFQSLYFRQPIIAPWSTAGATLLIAALPNYTIEQAVGAYFLTGILTMLLGMSGLFSRAMQLVPTPVVMGLIAGILLNFGMQVFRSIQSDNPLITFMVIAMIVAFFLAKRFQSKAPSVIALVVGGIIALLGGQLNFSGFSFQLTTPIFIQPTFDIQTTISLVIPLFALGLTAQYAPGQAVLRASGYEAPINGILTFTGIAAAVMSVFGGIGPTLGALTAAIVASPESEADPDKRYANSFMSGVFYFTAGLFGVTILGFFAAFPKAFVDVLAGLALTGTITSSLATATADPDGRDSGIAAFLCTASGMTFLGIGASFWGLLIGIAVYRLLDKRKPKTS
jgi:benzoate membrane transport protein